MTWSRSVLLFLCTGVIACVPGDIDLEGRPCPCIQGYVCVDNVCVLPTDGTTLVETDAAPSDVGSDAGRDGGPSVDAGPDVMIAFDVGGSDAPPMEDTGPGSDAGPGPDAGPDVPVVDAGPTLSFCDRHGARAYACLDFDEDLPVAWTRVESGGGEARFDSTRAVSGRSLRVSGEARSEARYERIDIGNVSSGKVWVRMRVFVESGGADNAYFPILSLGQRLTEPYAYFVLALAGGPGRIRTALSRGALGFVDDSSEPDSFPTERWFCLETEFDVAETTPIVTYLNGSEISRFQAVTAGTFDRFHVGIDEAGTGQSARTVWLDDVVWSQLRVGCELE